MKASFTEAIIEEIIKPVLPKEWLQNTRYLVNPTGRFVVGGPQGRLRLDRPQDHCGHLRRCLPPRRWCLLRQGPIQSGPFCCLRRTLRGQKRSGRRSGQAVPGASGLRHWRGQAT